MSLKASLKCFSQGGVARRPSGAWVATPPNCVRASMYVEAGRGVLEEAVFYPLPR